MLQDIRLLEQARALFANNVYIRTPYYQFAGEVRMLTFLVI